MGGNWSGLPSMHFVIPCDVFEYLHCGDTEKTFGRLCNDDDVMKLVERTRNEIQFGVKYSEEGVMARTKPTNTEVKGCGHTCTISSLKQGEKYSYCMVNYFSSVE